MSDNNKSDNIGDGATRLPVGPSLRQIYAYTGAFLPGEEFVRYCQLFADEMHIEARIRNGQGAENRICLPRSEAGVFIEAFSKLVAPPQPDPAQRQPTSHSPGPWRACHNGKCTCGQVWSTTSDHPVAHVLRGEWGDEYPAIRLSDNGLTAEAYTARIGYGSIGDEQAEANARLIAAAPDLLQAAQCALGHMAGNMDGDWDLGDPVAMLREAIAKALNSGGPTGSGVAASPPNPNLAAGEKP